MSTNRKLAAAPLAAMALALWAWPAAGQIAVSSNDNKVRLEDGVVKIVANPPADTITVIDLAVSPPRVIGEAAVPGSVTGPPFSVAITPDESLALVGASQKIDPANPARVIPNNQLSVVDLKASPPRVIATLEAGAGVSGISINRAGTLALAANRAEGTVSVFRIRGREVAKIDTIKLGEAAAGVAHVAITPDGRWALASRDGDSMISVLSIDGDKVEYTKRDITAGVRPICVVVHPGGNLALAANIGRGQGDANTVSVIDLSKQPFRVIDTLSVGQTPEGLMISPDGRYAAVVLHNGSNKSRASPFFNDNGLVALLRIDGAKVAKIAEAPIGHWSQGAVFSADSRTLLVQNMVERNMFVFRIDGDRLIDTAQRIATNGGPAAIRIADKPR